MTDPGENDSDAELDALSAWVAGELGPDVPLHFTAYHPDFKLKRPPTPASTLRRARAIARRNGLRYVYLGNIEDPFDQCTYCPKCGQEVIGRDGYEITAWRLRQGRCAARATPIPGRFDEEPGRWGARRMPVRIGR